MIAPTEQRGSSLEHVDPRVRRTRKLLQDAFRFLIRSRRFSEISVQDIAEQAMVNRATFYAHYMDKHDLGTKVLKADLRDAVLQRFTGSPPLAHENLVLLAVAVFEFMGRLHDACPKTAADFQNTAGATLQEELHEIIDLWISRGNEYLRLFPGCAKETVVMTISWSIYGGSWRWSQSLDRRPAAVVCKEIISILLPPKNGG